MNFGFNSNVHIRNTVYHVQTEDRGPAHPYLDTVVYETGRVVHKRSTSYEAFAATVSKDADFGERLHELLAQQHREVIGQLEAGTLALVEKTKARAEPPEKPRAQATSPVVSEVKTTTQTDGLDVRLTNPKTWLASGGATPEITLEIELRRRRSQRVVDDAEVEALLEHEKERVHCRLARTDSAGRATLKFSMPAAAADGSSFVIRATDGSVYGELRFRLKAKHSSPVPVPAPE